MKQGYSLRSTQDILEEKGSKHRMNRGAEKRKKGVQRTEKRVRRTEKGVRRTEKWVRRREKSVLWGHCTGVLLQALATHLRSEWELLSVVMNRDELPYKYNSIYTSYGGLYLNNQVNWKMGIFDWKIGTSHSNISILII